MDDINQKILAELCAIHDELKRIRDNMLDKDMFLTPEEEKYFAGIYALDEPAGESGRNVAL